MTEDDEDGADGAGDAVDAACEQPLVREWERNETMQLWWWWWRQHCENA